MRFHFKTGYDHDIRLFPDAHRALRYAALVALAVALPFLLDDFLIGEATNVLIWAIAGMGLMVLTGHAGQPSLGHAAFLAAGCYANAILMDRFGLPFLASFTLAGLLTGLAGVHRRDSRAQTPRHLSRHRDPRAVDPDRGHHRPGRAVDRRRGGADCSDDRHRRGGTRPLRIPRSLLLALSRSRGARHPRLSQHPARAARKGLRRGPRFGGVGAGHGREPGPDQGCRVRTLLRGDGLGRRTDGTFLLHLQPRGLHRRHFHSAPADDRDRRARRDPGRLVRRDRDRPGSAGDQRRAGLDWTGSRSAWSGARSSPSWDRTAPGSRRSSI